MGKVDILLPVDRRVTAGFLVSGNGKIVSHQPFPFL
jgi:hypothetical protein